MKKKSYILSLLFITVALAFCCGCTGVSVTNEDSTGIDLSHSSKADPDYSTVFPEDKVQVINIKISPENWQKMLDNMTEIYGEFGGLSTGGGPGDMNPGMMTQNREMPGGNVSERFGPGDSQTGMMPESDAQGRGMWMGDMLDEENPVYVPSEITFNDLVWEDVGIRFKGQMSIRSSWNEGTYKISFKLNFDKFEDENPEIKNQKFYGFDELNLQSGYNDDSLMRDMIVPMIFRDSGVVAPYTAYYRVYVDYGEGPVYFGLYTIVETVEDTVIETQFEEDSGNVYKPQGTGATFAEGTFDTAAFEKKTNEDDADWSDVEALYDIINSDLRTEEPERWREELESVFDVDEFLRWLATNTVIENVDTYGGMHSRNFYLYTDPDSGRITWIPWDNNFALDNNMQGGKFNGADAPPTGGNNIGKENFRFNSTGEFPMSPPDNGFMPGNMTAGDIEEFGWGMEGNLGGMGAALSLGLEDAGDNWPLIRYLADDPVYYDKYLGYLEMVATKSFEPEKMKKLYTYYHSLIEPYVTGPEGEIEGYTHLENPEAFATAVDELIGHAYDRHDEVMEFLSNVS